MKTYNRKKNVYEAAQERFDFIFNRFTNVCLSFSGGKDSGVMLSMAIDYAKQHNKNFSVLFIDLEAFYKKTMEYVSEIINSNLHVITPYWVCLPLTSVNSVSMYEPYYTFWDPDKKEKWVRPMPCSDYIINSDNHPFDFFKEGMSFEEFIIKFPVWLAKKEKAPVASLVGIRTDESLRRYKAIDKFTENSVFEGKKYSTVQNKYVVNFYPVYDWKVEDIWTYYGKFQKPYNRVYDLFYKAGIPLHKQRICEPFGDEQKAGLNLYKAVEPETWFKLVERVSGANFGNIYCGTKVMANKKADLPAGHTWKSYTKFLLKTLPVNTAENYKEKFLKFINYWRKVGGVVPDQHLSILPTDIYINTGIISKRGTGDKMMYKCNEIKDELPGLDTKADYLTWKRFALCILKNDITCQSLSFGLTKMQINKQRDIIKKYREML